MNEYDMQTEKSTINSELTSLIEGANHIAIIPSKVAGADAFSAAAGIFRSLKSLEKQVSFIYMGKIPEGCGELITSDEVTADVFERELLVSIDYSETPAARVHYSTENDVLYLKVKPIDKNFNLSRVKAEIKGFNYDLIITVGAQYLEDLGQVYMELKESFDSSKIINIDNTGLNSNFGRINLVDPSHDSLSLMVLGKLAELNYPLTKGTAKALLTGISTRNID